MSRTTALRSIALLSTFLLVISVDTGYGQSIPVGDPLEYYLRMTASDENLSDLPPWTFRPIDGQVYLQGLDENMPHPWESHSFFQRSDQAEAALPFFSGSPPVSENLSLYQPVVRSTYNSRLPFGQNDGPLWQGRGLNTSLSIGGFITYGPFEASIRPVLSYSQNRAFPLSQWPSRNTLSDYGSPYSYTATIDRPQRFGDDSLSRIYPGDSWIRLNYRNFTAGVSTANIWTGPAMHNPIVFSNNAPGFTHLFVGTDKPATTPVGKIHARLIWGGLQESDYFDEDDTNNLRSLNAGIISYSPSFIPGLHVGAVRTITKYYPSGGITAGDLFEVFQPFLKENFVSEENPRGNLNSHQLMSLFGRWVFPSYGMETYFEWSRNDHSGNMDDFISYPAHARGYVLGFLKRFVVSPEQWLSVNVEVTQLEVPRLDQFRHTGSFYNNGEIIQGFTNYGQVMGAGIGPGSNSQIIDVRYYEPRGLLGLSLNRVVHHNDRLNQFYSRGVIDIPPRFLHEMEMRLGLHALAFLPAHLELQGDLYLSKFFNYDYEHKNDLMNANLQLTLRYNLPGLRR